MPYTHTNGVDPTKPAGTDPSNVDNDMRDIKLAYNERFDDFFGTDWANDDPIVPTKIGPSVNIAGAQVYTNVYNAGNVSTSVTLNWNNGDQQLITLTGTPVTISFSNLQTGATYFLYVNHNGARAITFSGNVYVSGGTGFGTFVSTGYSIISLTVYRSNNLLATVLATGLP